MGESQKRAKVITLGLQKGGVSKTTTTGILAYLLANDGYKVLVCDMDSQGNITEMLTNETANIFTYNTIFQAIVTREPREYIYKINENIDILPSNNFLSLFPRWLYTKRMIDPDNVNGKRVPYTGEAFEQLDLMLEDLRDDYDFVLIDTPPSLSEHTINSLIASDYVIVLYECSMFCYYAIPNFMDSVKTAQKNSRHKVEPIGILRNLNDRRRSDAKLFNEKIAEDYPSLVFKTIISRKASTGRLPFYGFEENIELNDALSQFIDFYKELMERLRKDKDE